MARHPLTVTLFLIGMIMLTRVGFCQLKLSKEQAQAVRLIDQNRSTLIALSDSIWRWAEPSLKEYRSARLLINYLKAQGFSVQENVSGFPTVFIASYGNSGPVIGLFGEYDADPRASNKVVPRKDPLVSGGYGHGGSHNLLGVGSIGAAVALKDLIKTGKLKCTIRYYGTTAEGSIGSKTYLARDGYFNDLNLSLYWHPAPVTLASTTSWDAMIHAEISFILPAKPAAASADKEVLELMIAELRKFRLRSSDNMKVSYELIQRDDYTVVDTVAFSVRIQSARQADALALFQDLQAMADSVAAATGTTAMLNVKRAMHQFLTNVSAMKVVQKNMERLGPIIYTAEESLFTKDLQIHLGYPTDGIQDKIPVFADLSDRSRMYGYSSDIGDASWIAPEIYFVVKSLPGVAMHQWPGTIFSAHSIGHKGMIQASKILATTIIDVVKDPALLEQIHADFEKRKGGYRYQSLLSPGAPVLE